MCIHFPQRFGNLGQEGALFGGKQTEQELHCVSSHLYLIRNPQSFAWLGRLGEPVTSCVQHHADLCLGLTFSCAWLCWCAADKLDRQQVNKSNGTLWAVPPNRVGRWEGRCGRCMCWFLQQTEGVCLPATRSWVETNRIYCPSLVELSSLLHAMLLMWKDICRE